MGYCVLAWQRLTGVTRSLVAHARESPANLCKAGALCGADSICLAASTDVWFCIPAPPATFDGLAYSTRVLCSVDKPREYSNLRDAEWLVETGGGEKLTSMVGFVCRSQLNFPIGELNVNRHRSLLRTDKHRSNSVGRHDLYFTLDDYLHGGIPRCGYGRQSLLA